MNEIEKRVHDFNKQYNGDDTQLNELYAIAQIVSTPYYGDIYIKIQMYLKTTTDIRELVGEDCYDYVTCMAFDNFTLFSSILQHCVKHLYNHRSRK